MTYMEYFNLRAGAVLRCIVTSRRFRVTKVLDNTRICAVPLNFSELGHSIEINSINYCNYVLEGYDNTKGRWVL